VSKSKTLELDTYFGPEEVPSSLLKLIYRMKRRVHDELPGATVPTMFEYPEVSLCSARIGTLLSATVLEARSHAATGRLFHSVAHMRLCRWQRGLRWYSTAARALASRCYRDILPHDNHWVFSSELVLKSLPKSVSAVPLESRSDDFGYLLLEMTFPSQKFHWVP
jgi:hypothetical protein